MKVLLPIMMFLKSIMISFQLVNKNLKEVNTSLESLQYSPT